MHTREFCLQALFSTEMLFVFSLFVCLLKSRNKTRYISLGKLRFGGPGAGYAGAELKTKSVGLQAVKRGAGKLHSGNFSYRALHASLIPTFHASPLAQILLLSFMIKYVNDLRRLRNLLAAD